MHFEVSLESCAVGAVETVEGLLPCVYPDVGLQVSAVAKLPSAELTNVVPRDFVLLRELSGQETITHHHVLLLLPWELRTARRHTSALLRKEADGWLRITRGVEEAQSSHSSLREDGRVTFGPLFINSLSEALLYASFCSHYKQNYTYTNIFSYYVQVSIKLH